MRRRIIAAGLALATALTAYSQERPDTIYVSTLYTTHIVFSTDLTYGDLSNTVDIVSKIIESNKNMIAVKARQPFETTASISALESNGNIHTFIVAYREHPTELIIDTRKRGAAPAGAQDIIQSLDNSSPTGRRRTGQSQQSSSGLDVSDLRMSDAPVLEDVILYPRELYHLATKSLKVEASVDNIFAYSDITYVTVSLFNGSGVSYETNDAMFVVESRDKGGRKIVMESNLYPRNRYGSLTAAPGDISTCAYSLDKITLSKDQVLKVYIYETGGQRNLELTLRPKDINLARRPVSIRKK